MCADLRFVSAFFFVGSEAGKQAAGVSQATPWVAYLDDITSGSVQVEGGFMINLPNPNGWTLALSFEDGGVGWFRSIALLSWPTHPGS